MLELLFAAYLPITSVCSLATLDTPTTKQHNDPQLKYQKNKTKRNHSGWTILVRMNSWNTHVLILYNRFWYWFLSTEEALQSIESFRIYKKANTKWKWTTTKTKQFSCASSYCCICMWLDRQKMHNSNRT